MAGYWFSECLPYAIVSLLPIPLFPLFDIMASKDVTRIYFSDILMLFFGGLVLALSVESSGLHKKMAFKVILLFGSNPFLLLLGIMTVSGFLSLWISNVACASMMLPIVIAIVKQIARLDSTFQDGAGQELEEMTSGDEQPEQEADQLPDTNEARKLMKCFLLASTYSASIGGSGSLVGTSPNLILKGFFDKNYSGAGLNFFTFMLYAVPCAILMILSSWLVLSVVWLPKKYMTTVFKRSKKTEKNNLTEFIKLEYEKLGPFKYV
jgi:sodium-dependent dicarboxylate transporter 2/3/5